MKFVIIFKSSNLMKDLDPKIEAIRNSGIKIFCNMFYDENIKYYDKIMVELESFYDLITLAELLHSDITLDCKKHDDYMYHTLIVNDN